MEEARTCALQFHDRSAIAISGFAPSRACKRKARIGIRICVGTVECIPVGTSKRSARQRTPGGRRVDFPRGFSSETDPAGVGVMKTSAVIDEERFLDQDKLWRRCYLYSAELFKNFVIKF